MGAAPLLNERSSPAVRLLDECSEKTHASFKRATVSNCERASGKSDINWNMCDALANAGREAQIIHSRAPGPQ